MGISKNFTNICIIRQNSKYLRQSKMYTTINSTPFSPFYTRPMTMEFSEPLFRQRCVRTCPRMPMEQKPVKTHDKFCVNLGPGVVQPSIKTTIVDKLIKVSYDAQRNDNGFAVANQVTLTK